MITSLYVEIGHPANTQAAQTTTPMAPRINGIYLSFTAWDFLSPTPMKYNTNATIKSSGYLFHLISSNNSLTLLYAFELEMCVHRRGLRVSFCWWVLRRFCVNRNDRWLRFMPQYPARCFLHFVHKSRDISALLLTACKWVNRNDRYKESSILWYLTLFF